jgi:hypothetical protein
VAVDCLNWRGIGRSCLVGGEVGEVAHRAAGR